MKRNLLLILALLVLGLITWYIVKEQEGKGKKSYDFSYREIALEDLEQLQKIIIVKRNEPPLTFTRKKDYWMVNEQYKARQNAIENMLEVIRNIRIDYVPPNSGKENIMKSFLRHGIKVSLYDKKDNILKSYYLGSSPADGIGTYVVMEGYEEPLVMSIPSMRGSVHPRFNYTLDEWRDMTVLDLRPSDIEEIKLSYPFNKKFSFHLKDNTIKPLHALQKPISGEPDERLIENYLQGFQEKVAEYIENSNPRKDSIIAQVPFCEISILLRNGDRKDLRFFYHGNKAADILQSQISAVQAFNPYHAERFFILSNWGDFYLGQEQVFRDIFWKYDSFFKE